MVLRLCESSGQEEEERRKKERDLAGSFSAENSGTLVSDKRAPSGVYIFID